MRRHFVVFIATLRATVSQVFGPRLVLSMLLVFSMSAMFVGAPYATTIATAASYKPISPGLPSAKRNQPPNPEARVVLDGITAEIVPSDSNIWKCACDTDGCWPGCFTVASATILEYWAKRGYPELWGADTGATLQRLRDLFPNLFCYNNTDNDGQPGESGYDAYDVAKGFNLFIAGARLCFHDHANSKADVRADDQ